MTTKEKYEIIIKALEALGMSKKGDKVSIEDNGDTISRVRLNGKEIGRFDFSRKTFVE